MDGIILKSSISNSSGRWRKSDPHPLINYGLPQGATLAAKGFNLYVKRQGDIIQKHNLPHKAYADDTNLIFHSKQKIKWVKG